MEPTELERVIKGIEVLIKEAERKRAQCVKQELWSVIDRKEEGSVTRRMAGH